MRRYKHLPQRDIFEALDKVRDALLAARDGNEVNEIINALFTSEEKLQLGRRILIAECLKSDMTVVEICSLWRVGRSTVLAVARSLERYPLGFELIENRSKKVEQEYQKKSYRGTGGSQLVFKRKEYTGFKRKDVKR